MKKLSVLLCMIFSFSAFADCNEHYRVAANKRERRNKLISLSVALSFPGLSIISGGVVMTTLAFTGMMGAIGTGTLEEANNTTFGKVHKALEGRTASVAKIVARKLKKEGIEVTGKDLEFRLRLKTIIADLNASEKACPYLGYDESFKDIYQVYNAREFSNLVAEEYLNQFKVDLETI